MSCPDWTSLAAHRRERRGVEPDGWPAALEHFDSCSQCRRAALAADPTLVFRRMPEIAMAPAGEADEVESMRRAVAAMRTASRVEASQRSSSGRRWAAAAVLAVAALSLGQDGGRIPDRASLAVSPVPGTLGQAAGRPEPWAQGLELAPDYQVDSEEFSVIMVYGPQFEDLLDG